MPSFGRSLTLQKLLDSFGDDRPVGAASIRDLITTLSSPTLQVATNQLPRWRVALGKMLSGQANARILCLGDSTTFGVGSNNANGAGGGDMVTLSYPTQLASILTNFGYPANAHSFLGFGSNAYESKLTNDGRITTGSSWSLSGTNATLTCGGCTALATTGTNSITFLPTANVDTFKIWGIAYGGAGPNGVLAAQINSGSVVTHDFGTTPTRPDSFTVTAALGANTLKLTWSSGGKVYVVGVEAYNSAAKQILVANAGWPGAGIKDLASVNTGNTTYDPVSMAKAFAPDLYLVSVGINDWRSGGSGLSAAQYKATLAAYCASLNSVADVMLVSPAPSQPVAADDGFQSQFVAAMHDVALEGGYAFVDNYARFISWTRNQALYGPTPTPGNLHPNMVGYSDFARSIAQAITAI